MEMTFTCSLLLSLFCTVTVGFFEPRLFFIEVLFSLSVIAALLLICLPASLHRALACVELSVPSGFTNTVRALP